LELYLILAWVVENFQLGDVRRSRALGEMAWGLMKAGVVGFAAIGRAMDGSASAASCISRVFRFCHNKSIDPRRVQAALVNLLVGRCVASVGRFADIATVAIDWHAYDNGDIYGLRVSLVTGSRALPLLWYEVEKADLKGQQSAMEFNAITDLITYRPPGVTWLILLDAGFGRSADLVSLLGDVGYFVVRQPVSVLVHTNIDCWTTTGNLPVGLGQVVDFGWVHWSFKSPSKLRVVAARLYEGKRPRRGRRLGQYRHVSMATQPGLCTVATNLPVKDFSAMSVIRIYARRFEIEHSFRDIKNATLGMDMEHVHLMKASTYSRLMCIVAIAEALLWLNGAQAEAKKLHLQLTPSRPRSGRRVLSLRNLGHLCLGIIPGSTPINRLLTRYLRPAIQKAPDVIGNMWMDAKDKRELKELARSPDELSDLPQACSSRKKGRRNRCCGVVEWALTKNRNAGATSLQKPRAA